MLGRKSGQFRIHPIFAHHTASGGRLLCVGEYVGLEEIDNGIWNVYFGPLKLGRLDERQMRIEDQYGRLKRKTV